MRSILSRIGLFRCDEQQTTQKPQRRTSLIWQTLGLLVLFFMVSAVSAASYRLDNSSSTNGLSNCTDQNKTTKPTSLQVQAEIVNEHFIKFTVKKQSGSFESNGTLYWKVGSYEEYGKTRKTSAVNMGDFVVFSDHDLDLFDQERVQAPDGSWSGGYPKDFYARFVAQDATGKTCYSWVGPIRVSQQTTTTNPTTTTSPNYLTVHIGPSDAGNAGQWYFMLPNSSRWDGPFPSGKPISLSSVGNAQVKFSPIDGWTLPSQVTVENSREDNSSLSVNSGAISLSINQSTDYDILVAYSKNQTTNTPAEQLPETGTTPPNNPLPAAKIEITSPKDGVNVPLNTPLLCSVTEGFIKSVKVSLKQQGGSEQDITSQCNTQNVTAIRCSPTLAYGQSYTWKVDVLTDESVPSSKEAVFTTVANNKPVVTISEPKNLNLATNIPLNVVFEGTATDTDDGIQGGITALLTEVNSGVPTNGGLPNVGSSPASPTCTLSGSNFICSAMTLKYGQTYDLKITATDKSSQSGEAVSQFTTVANSVPRVSDPKPISGATALPITGVKLTWTGKDDDEGDLISYKLCLSKEATSFPEPISLSVAEYVIPATFPLENGKPYYWKVIASDASHTFSPTPCQEQGGGLWSFETNRLPTVTIIFPQPNNTISVVKTEPLTGTVTDDGVIGKITLSLTNEGAAPAQQTSETPSVNAATDSKPSEIPCTLDTKNQMTCPLSNLDYGQNYTAKVCATDASNAIGCSAKVAFKTAPNNAPKVTNISPANGSELTSLKDGVTLTWKGEDTENDTISYNVYLNNKQLNTSPLDKSTFTIPAGTLEEGQPYYWSVGATDKYNSKVKVEEIWSFTTPANKPPTAATGGSAKLNSPKGDVTLSWKENTDPENDPVTYQVCYGETETSMQCNPQSMQTTTYQIDNSWLTCGKSYFWKILSTDNKGNGKDRPVPSATWKFDSAKCNTAPSKPTDGAISEDKTQLFWTASEDEDKDPISYTVCYHKKNQTGTSETCGSAQDSTSYALPKDLGFGETYEWLVKATDNKTGTEPRPVLSDKWEFSTVAPPITFTLTTESGYATNLLTWKMSTEADVTDYQIKRVEGNNPDLLATAGTVLTTVKTPNSQYPDDSITAGTGYCYQVNALDVNGHVLSTSNSSCVEKSGVTTLRTKNIGGTKEDGVVFVPIETPNAGNMTVGSGDIWLEYDSTVIKFERVKTTNLTNGYYVDSSFIPTTGDKKILSITIEYQGANSKPPTITGLGSLVDVGFTVVGAAGSYSPLRLVPFVKSVGGTNIQDTDQKDIELNYQGDEFRFNVNPRSAVRDGERNTSSYFYVGEAYVRGDLNGNGTIQTVDAVITRLIGVGKQVGSPEQLIAGDVNSDNQVDNADANLIIYRTLNAKWPELPATQTRRSLRDGKQSPIVLGLTNMEGVSGGEVKTTLSIENVSDLNAMNLSIFYDPNVVKSVVKVEKVGLIAGSSVSMSYYDKGNGALNIGIDSQSSINGSGELLTITLQLATGGTQRTAPIAIAIGHLYDAVGRNFVISALQRQIESSPAYVTRTDVPPPVEVETPKPEPEQPVEQPTEEEPVQPEMIPLSELLPKDVVENKDIYAANGYFLDDQGNPIMGATVQINGRITTTDETGYWVILGLPAGEHVVTMAYNGNTSTQTCTLNYRSACRVEIGGLPEEIIALPPSTPGAPTDPVEMTGKYMMLGTVKDKSKTALSGVTMSVATPAGEKTAVTDAAGNWEIGGLPEGEYAVKGTADNFTCLADIALGNEMYRQPVVCKQVSSLKVSTKSKPSRAIYQGENLTYLLTVTNASNKVATGVVLENYKLPEGIKVVSLTPLDGGECNLETVSCLLPDLTPGTTARAELVLSDLAAGQFHHTVHLSAEGIPTADQINTWKQVKPYLSTAVTCTPNPVEMQKQLHCTATAELSSFAPEPIATGVKLQLILPKGTELKQVVAPHGECDTSQPGKLLCPLKDLSIAASDQVSKTTVDVDLQLVDSGLLVLTTEAKLTATNYAEHIASRAIRIAIPEDIEVDLVIAVDTTYSMNRIINGIIKPLEDFIQKQLADPTVMPPLTVLEEFKDDVRLVIPPTRDMKAVLDALRNLKIDGGGTCPEASVDALNLAADYLKKDGVILGATNAPARPDADVEALKKRLREMEADGAKIFFIYQPECDVTSGIEQGAQGLGDIAAPAFPTQ